MMNDLIRDRLPKVSKLQENMELNKLDYKEKSRKKYNLNKTSLLLNIFKNSNN